MASPLDSIKSGIETGDWKKVVAGYNRMSGGKLKAPKGTGGPVAYDDVPAEVKARIEQEVAEAMLKVARQILSETPPAEDDDDDDDDYDLVGDDDEDEEEDDAPSPPRREAARDFTHHHRGTQAQDTHEELGLQARREPFKKRKFKNTFVDDGTIGAADIAFDKKVTAGLAPSPRRPEAKLIKVVCEVCNSKKKVVPGLVPRKLGDDVPRFVCDRCSPSGKGMRRG